MKKTILLFLILAFSLGYSGGGGADQVDFPDIYIDASAGGGGVGSQVDPYDQLSDVNWTTGGDNSVFDYLAGAPAANVTINLNKGEEWREQLTVGTSGTAAFPILIQTYGAGADPIINGADVVVGWTASTDFPADGNCQGAWMFESDGSDSGSNSNDLSANGGATADLYTDLERDDNQFWNRPDNAGQCVGLDDFSEFTFYLKFKTEDITHASQSIVSKEGGAGGDYRVRIVSNGSVNLRIDDDGSGQHSIGSSANGVISTGVDYSVIVTVSSTDDKAKIYINGIQSGGDLVWTPNTVVPGTGDFRIGADPSNKFDGIVYEVAVFDDVLSAGEITALSTYGLGGPSEHHHAEMTPTSNYFVLEDGTRLEQVLTGPGFLNAGESYYDSFSSSVFVRCTDNAAPATHTMELPERRCVTSDAKNYITIDGLNLRNSGHSAIGLKDSTNWIIQNNAIFQTRSTGVFTDDAGGDCGPLTINSNTFDETGRESIYISPGTVTSSTLDITDNTITDPGWDISGDGTIRGDAVDIKASNTATITVSGNTISWVNDHSESTLVNRQGIVTNSAITASQNTITNPYDRGIYCSTVTGHTITRNIIKLQETGRSNELAGIRIGTNDNDINYNIIYSTAVTSGTERGIRIQGAVSGVNVYNNVIYGVERGIEASADMTTTNIKNNIVVEYSGFAFRYTAPPTGLSQDYNCVYTSDGGAKTGRWGGTEETTWAGWKTTSSQDANSINTDPLLTNPGADDFTLQFGSPCMNRGTFVGLLLDFLGLPVPIGHRPDIGAYEHKNGSNAVFQ